MAEKLLSRNLPPAVRLTPPVDSALLLEDLERVSKQSWRPEEPFKFDGFFGSETKVYHDGQWTGLSLRSQGGRLERTDPGGPGLEDFADTPLMQSTPYIAEMIGSWNVPLRSVRLLRLPPGASIGKHRDTYHGFEYGQLRLHVPITTNEHVATCIRGQRLYWTAGELWYGDFGSLHSVHNGGATGRVHLVVDTLITPPLLRLFPDEVATMLASNVDILYQEEPSSLSPSELQALECTFRVPSTLVRGIFDVDDGIVGELESRLHWHGNDLLWEVDGRNVVRLIPLLGDRLMFAGWTMERYFSYGMVKGRIARLELVLRYGCQATRVRFWLS